MELDLDTNLVMLFGLLVIVHLINRSVLKIEEQLSMETVLCQINGHIFSMANQTSVFSIGARLTCLEVVLKSIDSKLPQIKQKTTHIRPEDQDTL